VRKNHNAAKLQFQLRPQGQTKPLAIRFLTYGGIRTRVKMSLTDSKC